MSDSNEPIRRIPELMPKNRNAIKKLSKPIRTLFNVIGLIMIGWIGYVIYGSITYTGIWKTVVELLVSETTGKYYPAGAFALSALIGVLPGMGIMFVILWVSNALTSK